jgi:hypothetical protein
MMSSGLLSLDDDVARLGGGVGVDAVKVVTKVLRCGVKE